MDFDAFQLQTTTLTNAELSRSLENIGSCVSAINRDGTHSTHELNFIVAKAHSNGPVLIFDADGISDTELVIHVDTDGRVVGRFKNGAGSQRLD